MRECLGADNPPELPGRGADGFQKAVEADIPRHGDLEHIVDDEVPGEQNEGQHSHNDSHHGGVQLVRKLCPGVAPVDAGGDVVFSRCLRLIAVVG